MIVLLRFGFAGDGVGAERRVGVVSPLDLVDLYLLSNVLERGITSSGDLPSLECPFFSGLLGDGDLELRYDTRRLIRRTSDL